MPSDLGLTPGHPGDVIHPIDTRANSAHSSHRLSLLRAPQCQEQPCEPRGMAPAFGTLGLIDSTALTKCKGLATPEAPVTLTSLVKQD